MKCAVCERNWSRGVTITLTPKEREALTKAGMPDVTELFYCNPCHKLLSQERVKAAKFMQGLLTTQARSMGLHPTVGTKQGEKLLALLTSENPKK